MHCNLYSCCSRGFCLSAHLLMLCATAFFIAILFLQSGWDKIADRDGNLVWLNGHFKNTRLTGFIPYLLSILTLLELLSGTFTLGGIAVWIWKECAFWLTVGFGFAALSLLCLFAGQRIAKDYAGAASLVPYFLLIMFGLWLVS